MVAVNFRNLFNALVLSTLLIQCFAVGVNTNLAEHDALKKNASAVKAGISSTAAVVIASSTEHGAQAKPVDAFPTTPGPAEVNADPTVRAAPFDALPTTHGPAEVDASSTVLAAVSKIFAATSSGPLLSAEHGALYQNVSSVNHSSAHPSVIGIIAEPTTPLPEHPAIKKKLPSARFQATPEESDHIGTLVNRTTTPATNDSQYDDHPGMLITKPPAYKASSTANHSALLITNAPKVVSSAAASTTTRHPKFTSTAAQKSTSTAKQLIGGDGGNSTVGNEVTSTTTAPETSTKSAADFTTISSLVLGAVVGLLFI